MFAKLFQHENSALINLLVKIFDVFFYLLASLIAFYLQFKTLQLNTYYVLAILIATILFNFIFSSLGVYKSLRGRSLLEYLRPLLLAMALLILALAAIAFITKKGEYYSRAWFLAWHSLALIFLISFRILFRQLLNSIRKHGLNQKAIIIIGTHELVEYLVNRVKTAGWSGFKINAIFEDIPSSANINGIPVLNITENINEYLDTNKISEVWITLSLFGQEKINELVENLQNKLVTVRYFPNIKGSELLHQSVTELLGLPVINIIASPMNGVNLLIKAIEDKIVAALILCLISPVFLLIALAVKLTSPGPVFYVQERVGWNGKIFKMLKFRSMPVGVETKTGAVWTTAEDKRATKFGAFLRKTSLDELPQFINVLKGDMSIVGPRPERQIFVDKFKTEIPAYMQKHLVKAGITGWAQVNGWRGNTSLEKRIAYDLYYINHWSLWFDLKIIFFTIFKGFINKNAY